MSKPHKLTPRLREALETIWAGSARRGRWLQYTSRGLEECEEVEEGAEWYPYSEAEQVHWLKEGVVPNLAFILWPPLGVVPEEVLEKHGFDEEPDKEDD